MIKTNGICVECGRSTVPGSGLFINRVPVFDSPKENREMGRHFPNGTHKCRECEEISEMFGRFNGLHKKDMESIIPEMEDELK